MDEESYHKYGFIKTKKNCGNNKNRQDREIEILWTCNPSQQSAPYSIGRKDRLHMKSWQTKNSVDDQLHRMDRPP